MVALITAIHILICLFLIIVVYLQSGQSGDIAAAFGGMGSQTAFGTRTAATMLTKATTWAAILFMLTSISLSVLTARRSHRIGSVLEGSKSGATKTAPAPSKPLPPVQQAPAPEPQPMTPSR
ncbi:MAG TPA: preprotein translocase subunit SecG [Bryocella sp.]|nr:preprotein translocase subunit SecG [Bryocella sp.]